MVRCVKLSSEDRLDPLNTNASDCEIDVSKFGIQGEYIALASVSWAGSFSYNVNSKTNQFSITVVDNTAAEFPLTVTLPTGSFTATGTNGVVPALQNALNSQLLAQRAGSPASFFTVSYNSLTNYVSISTSTPNWYFKIPDPKLNSLGWTMGLRQPVTTNQTSLQLHAGIDLRGVTSITLACSAVQNNFISPPYGEYGALGSLPATAAPFQTNYYEPYNIVWFPCIPHALSTIRFRWLDDFNQVIPNDLGVSWVITLYIDGSGDPSDTGKMAFEPAPEPKYSDYTDATLTPPMQYKPRAEGLNIPLSHIEPNTYIPSRPLGGERARRRW